VFTEGLQQAAAAASIHFVTWFEVQSACMWSSMQVISWNMSLSLQWSYLWVYVGRQGQIEQAACRVGGLMLPALNLLGKHLVPW
jgi:hypothetical protein